MYCPQCGIEYKESITVCTDCGLPLTAEPPAAAGPEAEFVDLETILATSDPSLMAVARSLLEAEGIPCSVSGDLLQDVVGVGRLPMGVNLATGPARLQVVRERAEEARALLATVNVAMDPPAGEAGAE
jgi:Putative prokaryotic signal transducing protein